MANYQKVQDTTPITGPYSELEQLNMVLRAYAEAKEQHPAVYSNWHEFYAILLEEVDELWLEIKKGDAENAVAELLQVMAVGLRALVQFNR